MRKMWTICGMWCAAALVAALWACPARAADPSQDLNGDGYTDIIVSSWNATGYLFAGDENYQYTSGTLFPPLYNSIAVMLADFDKDNDLDALLTGYYSQAVYIASNNGSGSFTSTQIMPASNYTSASVADLNKDSLLDIVMTDQATNNVRVHLATGLGTYSSTPTVQLAAKDPWGTKIADVDRDGNLDLVVPNRDWNNATSTSYVYWGLGNGQFGSTPAQLTTNRAYEAAVADLNGDSHMDIVFANFASGDMVYQTNSFVYWGQGDRQFSPQPLPIATDGAATLAVGDVDNDGYFDIAFTNYTGGTISVRYGDPLASYSSKLDIPIGAASGYMAMGDINHDGYLDIAVSQWGGYSYIYWGDPDVPFGESQQLMSPSIAIAIAGSGYFAESQSYGNVIPLWATDDTGMIDEMMSVEYSYIALQEELLNDGALDLDSAEIALLAGLYRDGKAGLGPDTLTIDGMEWGYFSETIAGHGTPSSWYEDGKYYFQFGSGVTTDESIMDGGGEVPEPSTLLLLLPLAGFGMWRRMRRSVRCIQG